MTTRIKFRGGPRHGDETPDTQPGLTLVVYDDLPPVLLGVPDQPEDTPQPRTGRYVDTGDTDADGNRLFRWVGWDDAD